MALLFFYGLGMGLEKVFFILSTVIWIYQPLFKFINHSFILSTVFSIYRPFYKSRQTYTNKAKTTKK
ncbi:MAG: hypothetical protein ACQEWF_09070 [Bacillota bacterium]